MEFFTIKNRQEKITFLYPLLAAGASTTIHSEQKKK